VLNQVIERASVARRDLFTRRAITFRSCRTRADRAMRIRRDHDPARHENHDQQKQNEQAQQISAAVSAA
jgi:hypothetical protein